MKKSFSNQDAGMVVWVAVFAQKKNPGLADLEKTTASRLM